MQRTTALATALLAAALLAAGSATADAATSRLIVRGAGFGHGVGMSQWGAYGYAKQGTDYRGILSHYFTGTTLQPVGGDRTVRVLLKTGRSQRFSGATAAGGEKLDPATTYSVATSGISAVAIRDPSGKTVASADSLVSVTGAGPVTLRGSAQNHVTSGAYRGALEFRRTAVGGLLAINAVGLEDYVRGVVSGESPGGWPAAALQAQAVAARTYAITTAKTSDQGYDQYADERSQVYRGVKAEMPATDAAVAATANEVVAYDGVPAVTYFFSTSGGHTENVENAFPGAKPQPWLVGVDDPYDTASPYHVWGPITLPFKSVDRLLKGLVKGSFRNIAVTKRGSSPRVLSAEIVGTGGRTVVTGADLRARFGLRDTWMTFRVLNAKGQTVKAPKGDQPGATPAPTSTTPATNPVDPATGGAATGPAPATTAPPASDPGTGGAAAG